MAAGRQPRSVSTTLSDGRRLHALAWPGRGTPIVFLHGMLDSAEGWTEVCRTVSRPCVAVDLAGFGASELPEHPAFSAYARDVIEMMNALDLGEVVIVGHSLGGGVAASIAERIPERVLALVLLAPAGFGRIGLAELVSIPGVRNVSERVLLPLALGSRLTIASTYRLMVTHGKRPTDDVLDRVIERRTTLVPAAREATKAVVRAGFSQRAFHRRRLSYDGPVHAVWGDRDRIVPISHMAGVATAYPHVQEQVWEGMGHDHKSERLDELLELIETVCRPFDRRTRAARAAA